MNPSPPIAAPSAARRFRKATIEDVAQRAGVSKTTISAFVNGHARSCSRGTAQRIEEAIAELHYVPARGTRGQRDRATRTLGVCVASPFELQEGEPAEFFGALWRGFSEAADESGHLLLHYPREIRAGSSCDAFLDGSIDGLLFRGRHDARVEPLAQAGLPLVLVNTRSPFETCGSVCADENETVDRALSHLWELGHRRIAHLAGPIAPRDDRSGPPPFPVRRDHSALWRHEAFVNWMSARGAFDSSLIAHGELWQRNEEQAARAVQEWRRLEQPPTAVFCANDTLALNLMRAAEEAGWRVPHELSVVGVGNSTSGATASAPLTSVDIPLREVGRQAVQALLRLMSGASATECQVVVPVPDIVVRASTAAPAF